MSRRRNLTTGLTSALAGIFFLGSLPSFAQEFACPSSTPPPKDAYEKAVLDATAYRQADELEQFIKEFDTTKKTIILLPGGAGSKLWRADKKPSEVTGPHQYKFKEIWLKLIKVARGAGDVLKVSDNNRDVGDRVIVSDEGVRAVKVKPYKKAMKCFGDADKFNFNTLLLAWDWRRDPTIAVDRLEHVTECIKSKHKNYEMKNVFIVGHSMGGLVAKIFFQTKNLAKDLGGMVSVGTPFYGYLGQLQRMFEGEQILNRRNAYTAKQVAEILSAFPGLYTVLPIHIKNYNAGKKICERLPSTHWCHVHWPKEYPVKDLQGNDADAYQKGAPPLPHWARVDDLKAGLELRRKLTAELPDDLNKAVYHIRSKIPHSTAVAAKWRQSLCPEEASNCDYDPDIHPSPIEIRPLGAGDETIPYWSAALISTPEENLTDLKIPAGSSRGKHSMLLAENAVLQRIRSIVAKKEPLTEAEMVVQCGSDPEMATVEELKDALDRIDRESSNLQAEIEGALRQSESWRLLQEIGM